ncbi:MAG: hypothetical protein RBT71_13425 [Flavobacteriales bacterium]|nr:hypothetical protein [Flavobacteriales bacterium]
MSRALVQGERGRELRPIGRGRHDDDQWTRATRGSLGGAAAPGTGIVQGFPEHKKAARAGGEVAGKARRDLETKSGRKVVTNENYLSLAQGEKNRSRIAPAKAARKKRK